MSNDVLVGIIAGANDGPELTDATMVKSMTVDGVEHLLAPIPYGVICDRGMTYTNGEKVVITTVDGDVITYQVNISDQPLDVRQVLVTPHRIDD
jgi:hypothetical protein